MGCCLCPKKPKNENDPSANIEKNNEGESGEVISDAAAEEHDDSKRDNGTLNTEQDQTNSLNKHQGPDVSTSAPFPSESSDQPLVSSDVDSLNLLPLVTSGHLSPNPEKETSVTSVVKNPKKIKKSSMQQEEDQAQGQGFNPILPQNGPPVFAVPFPYFVPCSKCGSNEKNYLQQMSARPTPNTLANNYAVHSSLSHEVHDGIEQTFAQAYMGPPGSSPFNNMNFIKMHPTNDPKDTSIQTEDHNKNKFADNKNKFADHNIYSDIPNFPDSSQVPNKAGEQHPKRHITFLSQERQFNNDNQTDQSCQTQRRSSSVNEQYPYQDRSSVSQEQPETTVNQPRAYNKMPMQGYKHRGKGKTLVEDTTFFREDMKVVRHREISIWSRDKDSVKIPVPSRELFNILDRELEVHMQANRSREQSPEVKRARTRNNSRSPKTVQFSLTPDVDPLTDVYDEEGMYSMEEDNLLGRYENEAEMRREQTYRQKGQGMQILLGSPSTSNMPPSFSRSPKSTTTSPNLSRSPSPIARSPTPLVTPRSQRKVSYSLSCSAGTSSPPVELEASISPQSLSSRSTSSQTDNVEEQTPPLKNQPYNDLVRNSNLETGMLHLYKTMNELLLSKILLEQKLENLTEEIKLQRLQSDDEERHAKRTEKVEYNSNDEYYTITKEECLIGVTESSTGNLNWEPQSSQSNQNGEVKESIQGLSHKVDQMEAERHELKAQLENIQSKIDRIIALQKSRKLESITEHECSSDHSRAIHHQHLTTSAQYVYQSAEQGHISEHGKRKPSLEVTSGRRKSSALQDDKLPKLPDFVKMSPDSGRSSPLMFTGQPSDEENPESGQRFHDDNQSSNDYEPCQNSNQDVSDIDKDVYQNTFFPQASESHVPENKSSNQGDTPPINGERRNHDSRKVDSTPGTSEDESVMCCHCVLEDQSEVIQNPSEKQMMNESNESTPGSYQRDWIIKEMLHQLLEDTSEQSHSDLNQQKTKGESRNQSATDIIKSCVKEINTDQCIKDIGTKNNVRDNIQHSVKDMSTQYGVRDTSAQPSLLSAKDTSTHLNIRETSTQLSRDSMTDVSTQYRVREMSTQRYAVSGQDTSTQQSVKDNSAQQSAHSLKDTSTQQSVKDNSAQQSAHSLKDTSTQHSVRDTSAQHCRLIISDTSTQYSVRDMCTQHNTVSMQDTRTQQSVRDTSTQHSLKVTSTQQSVRDTSTQHSVHSLKDTSTQQSVRATSTQHSVHRLQEARTQHCFNNMSTQRNSLSMKDMSIQQSVRDTSAQHSVHNLKDMSTQHCVRDMSTQRSILSTKDMSTQQSVRDTSTQCSVHSLKDVSTQHCVRDMSTQHSILSMKDMSTQQSVRDTSTQHSVHNLKDTSTQQNVRDTQHSVRILKDVSTQHCFSNMSTQCSILSMKGLSSQQSVTDANKQYSVLNVKDPSTKEIVKKLSTEFRMNSLQDISTQQNMKYTSTQSMKDFRPQDNMSTQQRLREAKRLDDLKDIKNISKEQSPPKLTRTFHSLRDLSSKSGKDKSIQQRPRTVSVPNNFRESLSKSTKYMNREQTPHQPSKNYFQSMPMHAIKETSNENIFRQGSSGLSIEKMHEQNEQVIGNGQPRQQFDRRQSYIPTSLDMLDNPRESSTQNFQEINAKYISRYTSTTAMTSRDSEPQLSDRYLFGAKTWSPEYIEPLTTQHSTKTLNPRYKEPDQNEPSSKIKNNRDIELVKDKRTTSQQRPQAQTFRDVEECRVASEMKREYSPRDSHKQTELTEQINPREPSFHQRAPAQYGQLPCNVWTQNGQDHSNINMQVKQHSPSLGMQDRLHRVSIGAQDSYQSPNVGAQDRKLSHSVGTQDRQRSLSVGAQDRQHRIGGLDQTEDRQRSLSAGAQVGQHSFSAGAQDRQRSLSAGAQVGQHSFSAGAQDRQRSLSAGAQVGQHSFSAGAQVGQHSFSAGAQVGQHSLSAGAQDRQRSLSAGAQVGQHSFSAGAQDRQRSLSAGAQVGQHSFSAGAQVGQHSFSAGAQVGQHSLSAGAQDRQRSLSAGAQVGQHSLSAGAQDRQRSLSAGAQVGQHSSSAGAQDRKLSHSVGTQGRQHSLSVGDLGKQQSFSVLNQDRQNGLSAVDQGRQYNLDVGTQGTRHKPSFGAQDRQRSLSVGAQDRQRRHGVVDQTQDRQRSLSAGAQVRQHSSSAGAQDRQCSLSAGAQVGQHSFSAGAQDRKLSHSVGTQGRQHSLSVGDLGKQQSFSVLNQDRQNSLSAVDQGRQYNLNVGTQGTQHKPSFGAQGRQHSLSVGAQYGQCRNGVEDQTQYRQRSLSAGAQVRQHSSSAGAQDRQQSPFVKTHPRRESKQQPSEIIIQESSIDTVKLNSMRKTGSMEEMFGESWMRVANQNDTELYSQDNIRDMYDNCDMREVCDPEEKVGESAHKKIIYDKEYDQDDKVDQSAHKMVRNDKQYTRKVSVHWYPREQTNFKGNNRQQLTDISGQQDMEETQQIPLESRRLQSQSDKCEQQNESETNKHKMMSERTNRLSPTNKFKNKLCMQPTPEEADEEQSLEENIIKQSKREVIKPASMITLQQKNVLHTPKAQSPQTSITTQDPEVLTNKDNLVNESESRHFTLSENASEENKLTAKPTQDDRQLGAEETDMSHYLPKILTCTSEHTFIHQTAFKSVTEKQDQRIILKQEKTIIPKQDLNPEMDLGNKTIDENIAAQVTVNMERLQRLHRKKSEKLRQKIQALKKYQKNLIETVKENCRKLLEKERSEQDTQLQAERLSKEKLKEAVVALQTQLSNMEREVWQAAMSREVIIKDITRDRAEWEKNKKEMEDEIKKLRLQKGDMTLKMENVHQQVVSLQAQVNEATQAAVDADLKEVRLNNKLKNYHDLMEVCNSKFQQHRDNEMKLQSELELVNQKLKEQEKDVEKLKLQLNDLRSLAIRRRRKIENLKAKQASEHAKHLEEKAITARVEKEKKEIEDKLLAETLRHQQLVDLIAGQGKRLSTIRSKMETLDPNSVLNELQVRFQSELNFILRQVDNYLENQADAAEAADAAQKEKAFRQRAESGNLSILQYRHTHLRAMKQVTSLEENLLKALLYSAKSSPYESQAYDKNESFNLFRSSYFKTVPRERHSHLMENPQISAHVEKIIRPFSRHNDLLQNTYISQRQSLGTPNDLWQSRLFARTGTTSSDWNTAQTRSVAPKTQSFGVFTAQLQPGTSTVNKTSAEFSQEWTEQDTNTPSVHGGSFHSNHWIKQGTCTSGESILLKSRSVQDANTQHGHRGSITSCIEAEQITSTLHEPRQSNTSRQEAEQFANAQHGHSGIVTFSLQTDDDNINIPVGCDGNTRSRLGIEQIASPQFEHNSRSWAEIGVQTFRQDYSTDGKLSHSSTKLVVHEFTETALPLASKQDFSQMFDGAPQTECASEQCKSSVYTDNLHVSSDPQNLSKSNPTIIYCTSSTEPLLNVCPMYLPSAQRPSAVVSLCPPLLSRSWPEQVEEQCTTEISVWDTNAHSQNEPGIDIHQFLSTSDITSPNPMPCPCPGPFPQTRQTQDQPQTKSHPKSQGHIRSQNHPQTQGHPQSREHPQSHEAPFHTVRTFHPAAPVSQISQHSPYIELSSTSQPHPYVVSYPTPFAFGIPQHPYLVSHSTPVPTSSPWHHPHMVPCSVTYPCKFESQDGLKYERNSTNVGHYLSTSVHSPNVLKQDFPKDGIKLTVHNKSVDSFSPQDTSKTSVKKDDILKRDNERMVKRIHSTKNTVSASSSLETEKISLGKKYISSNKYRVKNDKNIKSDPIQETSSGTFLDSETQAERPSMFLETKESSLLSLSQEETESKPDDVPLSDCSSKKDPFTM